MKQLSYFVRHFSCVRWSRAIEGWACNCGWGLCDGLRNLIKARRYQWFPHNGRHARIGAIRPLEVHVRNITQDVLDHLEVSLILHFTCFRLSVWSCSSGSHAHDKDESPGAPHKIPTFGMVGIGPSVAPVSTAGSSSKTTCERKEIELRRIFFGAPLMLSHRNLATLPGDRIVNLNRSRDLSLDYARPDEPSSPECHEPYPPACHFWGTVVKLLVRSRTAVFRPGPLRPLCSHCPGPHCWPR